MNAPKLAGVPIVSDSVAGTEAPAPPVTSVVLAGVCESSQEFQQTFGCTTPLIGSV